MAFQVKPTGSSGIVVSKSNPANRQVAVHRGHRDQLIPGFGNITTQDMVIARLKLLQGLSPEVKEDPRANIQGEWYHNTLGECLGESLEVVPLQIQRSVELWAPRDDDRGVLARSTDGVNWDKPNTKFEVRMKGKKVVWDTKGSVQESGLNDFHEGEPPIAPTTYRLALYMTERPELSPCLYIAARMAAKGVQDLISKVSARHMAGTEFWRQRFNLLSVTAKKGPNEFFVPSFRNAGNIEDEALADQLAGIAASMAKVNVRADDDRIEEESEARPQAAQPGRQTY